MGKQAQSIKKFYSSIAWQNCRDAYKKSVGGLCEECLKKGIISVAEEVHHKRKLNVRNINDPKVTLAWSNLEALCKPCHEAKHKKNMDWRRYTVDENGKVTPKPDADNPPY